MFELKHGDACQSPSGLEMMKKPRNERRKSESVEMDSDGVTVFLGLCVHDPAIFSVKVSSQHSIYICNYAGSEMIRALNPNMWE